MEQANDEFVVHQSILYGTGVVESLDQITELGETMCQPTPLVVAFADGNVDSRKFYLQGKGRSS